MRDFSKFIKTKIEAKRKLETDKPNVSLINFVLLNYPPLLSNLNGEEFEAVLKKYVRQYSKSIHPSTTGKSLERYKVFFQTLIRQIDKLKNAKSEQILLWKQELMENGKSLDRFMVTESEKIELEIESIRETTTAAIQDIMPIANIIQSNYEKYKFLFQENYQDYSQEVREFLRKFHCFDLRTFREDEDLWLSDTEKKLQKILPELQKDPKKVVAFWSDLKKILKTDTPREQLDKLLSTYKVNEQLYVNNNDQELMTVDGGSVFSGFEITNPLFFFLSKDIFQPLNQQDAYDLMENLLKQLLTVIHPDVSKNNSSERVELVKWCNELISYIQSSSSTDKDAYQHHLIKYKEESKVSEIKDRVVQNMEQLYQQKKSVEEKYKMEFRDLLSKIRDNILKIIIFNDHSVYARQYENIVREVQKKIFSLPKEGPSNNLDRFPVAGIKKIEFMDVSHTPVLQLGEAFLKKDFEWIANYYITHGYGFPKKLVDAVTTYLNQNHQTAGEFFHESTKKRKKEKILEFILKQGADTLLAKTNFSPAEKNKLVLELYGKSVEYYSRKYQVHDTDITAEIAKEVNDCASLVEDDYIMKQLQKRNAKFISMYVDFLIKNTSEFLFDNERELLVQIEKNISTVGVEKDDLLKIYDLFKTSIPKITNHEGIDKLKEKLALRYEYTQVLVPKRNFIRHTLKPLITGEDILPGSLIFIYLRGLRKVLKDALLTDEDPLLNGELEAYISSFYETTIKKPNVDKNIDSYRRYLMRSFMPSARDHPKLHHYFSVKKATVIIGEYINQLELPKTDITVYARTEHFLSIPKKSEKYNDTKLYVEAEKFCMKLEESFPGIRERVFGNFDTFFTKVVSDFRKRSEKEVTPYVFFSLMLSHASPSFCLVYREDLSAQDTLWKVLIEYCQEKLEMDIAAPVPGNNIQDAVELGEEPKEIPLELSDHIENKDILKEETCIKSYSSLEFLNDLKIFCTSEEGKEIFGIDMKYAIDKALKLTSRSFTNSHIPVSKKYILDYFFKCLDKFHKDLLPNPETNEEYLDKLLTEYREEKEKYFILSLRSILASFIQQYSKTSQESTYQLKLMIANSEQVISKNDQFLDEFIDAANKLPGKEDFSLEKLYDTLVIETEKEACIQNVLAMRLDIIEKFNNKVLTPTFKYADKVRTELSQELRGIEHVFSLQEMAAMIKAINTKRAGEQTAKNHKDKRTIYTIDIEKKSQEPFDKNLTVSEKELVSLGISEEDQNKYATTLFKRASVVKYRMVMRNEEWLLEYYSDGELNGRMITPLGGISEEKVIEMQNDPDLRKYFLSPLISHYSVLPKHAEYGISRMNKDILTQPAFFKYIDGTIAKGERVVFYTPGNESIIIGKASMKIERPRNSLFLS